MTRSDIPGGAGDGVDAGKGALLIGGTSDIGRAIAAAYLELGWSVTITGRDMQATEREASDLRTRYEGTTVETRHLEVLDTASFDSFLDGLPSRMDTAICVVGMLGDQERAQSDAD
ncbi:MAG: hypothetical protein AAF264_06270, partial [Pseudomonadota bacterium]